MYLIECSAIISPLFTCFCVASVLCFNFSIIRRELEKRRPLQRYEYDGCLLHRRLDKDNIALPAIILSIALCLFAWVECHLLSVTIMSWGAVGLGSVMLPDCTDLIRFDFISNSSLKLRYHHFCNSNVLLQALVAHHVTYGSILNLIM